jgi:hypothetical protein
MSTTTEVRRDTKVNKYQGQNGPEWSRAEQNRLAVELVTQQELNTLRDQKDKNPALKVHRGDTLGVLAKALTGKYNWGMPVEYRSTKIQDHWDHVKNKKYSSPKVGPKSLKVDGKYPTVSQINNIWPDQYVWIEDGKVIVSDALPEVVSPEATIEEAPAESPEATTEKATTPAAPAAAAPAAAGEGEGEGRRETKTTPATATAEEAPVAADKSKSPDSDKMPAVGLSQANVGLPDHERVLEGEGSVWKEVFYDAPSADLDFLMGVDFSSFFETLEDSEKTEFQNYYQEITRDPAVLDTFLERSKTGKEIRTALIDSIKSAEEFYAFEQYLLGIDQSFEVSSAQSYVMVLGAIAKSELSDLGSAIQKLTSIKESDLVSILNAFGIENPTFTASNIIKSKKNLDSAFQGFQTLDLPEWEASETLGDTIDQMNARKYAMAKEIRKKANEGFWENDEAGLHMASGLMEEVILKGLIDEYGLTNTGKINFTGELKDYIEDYLEDRMAHLESLLTNAFIQKNLDEAGIAYPMTDPEKTSFFTQQRELMIAQKYNQWAIEAFVDYNEYDHFPKDLSEVLSEYDDMKGINWFHNGWINFADQTLDVDTIGKEVAFNAALFAATGGLGIAGSVLARGLYAGGSKLISFGLMAGGGGVGGNLGMASVVKISGRGDFWETATDGRLFVANSLGIGLGRFMLLEKVGKKALGAKTKLGVAAGGGYSISGIQTGEWDLRDPEVLGNSLFNAALIGFAGFAGGKGTGKSRGNSNQERFAEKFNAWRTKNAEKLGRQKDKAQLEIQSRLFNPKVGDRIKVTDHHGNETIYKVINPKEGKAVSLKEEGTGTIISYRTEAAFKQTYKSHLRGGDQVLIEKEIKPKSESARQRRINRKVEWLFERFSMGRNQAALKRQLAKLESQKKTLEKSLTTDLEKYKSEIDAGKRKRNGNDIKKQFEDWQKKLIEQKKKLDFQIEKINKAIEITTKSSDMSKTIRQNLDRAIAKYRRDHSDLAQKLKDARQKYNKLKAKEEKLSNEGKNLSFFGKNKLSTLETKIGELRDAQARVRADFEKALDREIMTKSVLEKISADGLAELYVGQTLVFPKGTQGFEKLAGTQVKIKAFDGRNKFTIEWNNAQVGTFEKFRNGFTKEGKKANRKAKQTAEQKVKTEVLKNILRRLAEERGL